MMLMACEHPYIKPYIDLIIFVSWCPKIARELRLFSCQWKWSKIQMPSSTWIVQFGCVSREVPISQCFAKDFCRFIYNIRIPLVSLSAVGQLKTECKYLLPVNERIPSHYFLEKKLTSASNIWQKTLSPHPVQTLQDKSAVAPWSRSGENEFSRSNSVKTRDRRCGFLFLFYCKFYYSHYC